MDAGVGCRGARQVLTHRFELGRAVAARSRPGNDACVGMPQTKYAKTVDGVHIAYSVSGTGSIDLVWAPVP
jgi:hypothetical protein